MSHVPFYNKETGISKGQGCVTHSLIKKFLEKFSSIHTREVVADAVKKKKRKKKRKEKKKKPAFFSPRICLFRKVLSP